MELWQKIMTVLAGVVTLATCFKLVILPIIKPVAQADEELKSLAKDVPLIKTAISEHRKRLDKIELHQENDIHALKDHAEFNRVMSAAMLALLDHELNGNHTAQLTEAKDKLREYLINR
jgi:hypothetical protein